MIIGLVRPEEARVFDTYAGTHAYTAIPAFTFEVFWHNGGMVEDGPAEGLELYRAGWYWVDLNDVDRLAGPFASSNQARSDADPEWEGAPD